MKKISAIITLLISCTCNAQTVKLDMEPGLWQQSFKISSQSGEMEQMLPSVPLSLHKWEKAIYRKSMPYSAYYL